MRSSPADSWVAGLLLANLVPLVGVVEFGWGVGTVWLTYWLETGVVGAATVPRILRAEGTDDPDDLPSDMRIGGEPARAFVGRSNRSLATTFVKTYGFVWAFLGVFVVLFTVPILASVSPLSVAASVLALAAYHALAYRVYYLGDREYEDVGPATVTVEPFRRAIVLQVTVLAGGFSILELRAPVGAVVVLVVVKTALDLRSHRREHDRARGESPSDGGD